jgi:hypothetical protein
MKATTEKAFETYIQEAMSNRGCAMTRKIRVDSQGS